MININKSAKYIKSFILLFCISISVIVPNIAYAYQPFCQKNPMEFSHEFISSTGISHVIIQNTVLASAKTQDLNQKMKQFLLSLVSKRGDTSWGFYAFVLLIALIVGALHALTPGHGKAIVAAYLVGSNSTTGHALLLGAIVTLTHTGSVIILTLLMLAASHFFLSQFVVSILEIVSGAVVLILGIYLLIVRLRSLHAANAPHSHSGHSHGHNHDHEHALDHGHTHAHIHDHHHHRHNHSHGHDHDHQHDHDHGIPPSDVSWKSLLTLGLSGGIVPCPDAIVILFLAVSIKRILMGLAVMLSFSLGLAIVITSIGLAMVHSRKLVSKLDIFVKFAPVISAVSAAVVLVLGCVLTFNALSNSKLFF